MARLGRDQARVEVLHGGGSLYVSWRVFDRGGFEDVRESFKRRFPWSTGAEWSSIDKCWTLPTSRYDELALWVAATFQREAVSWPDGPHGQQQRQDAPRPAHTSPLSQAYAALHLLPSAPPEVVQAAHRVLVKRVHPDAGGTHEAAVALNTAVDLIHQHQTRSGAA